MSDKNKKSNSHIESDLKSIYQDKHGNLPDMSSLDHTKSSHWKIIILVSFVFTALIVAAAWSGFLWYDSKPSFTGERIDLSITAPFTVISGDKAIYAITITNNEDTTLRNNSLQIRFPIGFLLKTSTVEAKKEEGVFMVKDANNYKIRLEDIAPHSVSDVTITGQLISSKDVKPTIAVKYKYTPDQYSSEFEKNTTFTSDVSDSSAAITLTYPTQIIDGEKIDVGVDIKNVGKNFPLEGLRLGIELPATFKVESLTLGEDKKPLDEEGVKTFNDEKYISLANLEAESEEKIIITGSFAVEKNANEIIGFKLLQKDAKEGYIEQANDQAEFQIIKGDVLATLIANGSLDSGTINFDSEVAFLAVIKNKSSSTLGDVEVRLVADSPLLDWKNITDQAKGIKSSNQILWTSNEVPELKIMLPEDEVSIPFSIKTKSFESLKNINTELLKLQAFTEITVHAVDGLSVTKMTDSNSLQLLASSDTQLTSKVIYFDSSGASIGSGPLPPKVGEKTTYQVNWELSNSLHELQNISISAKLPANVRWEGNSNSDTGELIIVDDTISWKINRLPTSVNDIKGSFFISLTPTDKDVNKILSLLNETTLSADDAATKSTISLTSAPLTTKIDKNSSGLIQQ